MNSDERGCFFCSSPQCQNECLEDDVSYAEREVDRVEEIETDGEGRAIRVAGEDVFPWKEDADEPDPDPEEDDVPSLGPCCACGGTERVRNIIMLAVKGPSPGHGWGCVQCGLPPDGALAVLCDACLVVPDGAAGSGAECGDIKEVCDGYPGSCQRVPRETLTEPFDHDLSKHPELQAGPDGLWLDPGACIVCGCTDDHACEGGCHWVANGLCSRCAEDLDLV